jgi:2'-5' RNA ligase
MTVDRIKDAMGELRFQPFTVQFAGLGAFPNLRRISVVWVGITRGQEELEGIFQQLEPKLRKIGLSPDNKGFSPHMTIARVKSGINREALAKYIESMRDRDFGQIAVAAVRLKKSTLTPKGPIYTTIHEVNAST